MKVARKQTQGRGRAKRAGLEPSRPAVIYQDGKATSVLLDIKQYREMLELLEDLDDLAYLDEITSKPVRSRPFQEFLDEHDLS